MVRVMRGGRGGDGEASDSREYGVSGCEGGVTVGVVRVMRGERGGDGEASDKRE